MISKHKPSLVIIFPVCRAWCKATDLASKNQAQIIKLTEDRAIQSKLITKMNDILRIIMSYGGHVLIENPTYSKFWKQMFFKRLELTVAETHCARSFLLNRCRVRGIHFKQYTFFTSLPPCVTKHMERLCNHDFKHPPSLGRDANGNSVTKASGVYTKELVFLIVA